MIISNQQIALHLRNIRNLSGYTSGRFSLRISLSKISEKKQVTSIPVNIIEKEPAKSQNRSEFDDSVFQTKYFPLKSGANVQLQEIYLFKFDQPVQDNSQEKGSLFLKVELIQMDQMRCKVVGVFKGCIKENSLHQYLQMDFYETAPCQIVGSLHKTLYKFQFSSEENGIDLKQFCQKYWKSNSQDILQYLESQITKSYTIIAQNFSAISQRQVQIECSKNTDRKKYIKVIQKDVAERDTQLTEGDEETAFQEKIQIRKKRRRIFSTTREHRIQKYQQTETFLHENAQKIYTIWRQLLVIIMEKQGDDFINEKMVKHRRLLKQKIGESVASFKGSWDVDVYCDEQMLRNQLAYQLRNQDKDYFKEMNGGCSQIFNITNQAFFSNLRPIFFEEKAISYANSIQQQPKQILVFLVHGLGACRLDMQKIKVQMKRYFDTKVRIYSSSSNQGRTEGDIDSMGMRLAAEIDYQLCKYNTIPKICLVGHSMGGIIIRSALPRLEKYKKHFHTLITLSSPHLGYSYSNSKLVDAGLWLLNTMKKCTSILQMTMQDHEKIEETYLYKLSQKPGLQWFKKVSFFASHQDLYVPYYSARIQKHSECNLDVQRQVKKGIVHSEMVDNILSRVKGSIIRVNVNFCIPQQNLDNLIGRAAHISFITNLQMVRTFVIIGQSYIF